MLEGQNIIRNTSSADPLVTKFVSVKAQLWSSAMCELGATFVQLESLEHSQLVAEDKLNGSRK
jgi:hypothetical protein